MAPLRSTFVLPFLLSLLLSVDAIGRGPAAESSSSDTGQKSLAAQCAGPTASTELAFNNVRTLIQTSGDMWWDYIRPRYEVPKGGGNNMLFSGSLWMGGEDVNEQLKLAAHTYGPSQGNFDFWTGPLTTDGSASIDQETCDEYDRHWVIDKAMVEKHVAWAQNPQAYPDYSIPDAIRNWPAHGDVSKGQDFYLAPFYDFDAGAPGKSANATYEPEKGDYPHYDLNKEVDCRKSRLVTLYGDKTLWWVFNDKGNVHTQTNGDPIGMEVRAQAFAFATNDAVNDMTFYNYQLVNRGSQTLYDTYFAQWTDPDVGCSTDDFVGCDVGRGLGFAYNGDNFDEQCNGNGYGSNPPAIGVDFFEGPYQDSTGVANQHGIGQNQAVKGNGVGYGDTIVDNERFGMRHFFYHNIGSSGDQGDPETATDFYGYMRGIWKDGTCLSYGGDGYDPSGNSPCTDFMFPGDSDPWGWGTPSVSGAMPPWSERTAGNSPGDRRFIQSAGEFTLRPGDVNDITVGVVYAKAAAGDAYASVEKLKTVDSKAQSLFDNCFEVMDGPDAPLIEIQELDQELVLTLHNPEISNNTDEDYEEVDPFIPDSVEVVSEDDTTSTVTEAADRTYEFQGYKIYQLRDANVGPSDLDDPDLARLVAQVDIEDDVTSLINYELDEEIGASVPVKKAEEVNQGVAHSFSVTEDLFAEDEDQLINHQEYHFMAIAYAYNEFKPYDPNDPDLLDGQKQPYFEGRRAGDKSSIESVSGTPHITSPEKWGLVQNAEYGDEPAITRIEGRGNGGNVLDVPEDEEERILEENTVKELTYQAGAGPIVVKVVDPLNVPDAEFELRFRTDTLGDPSNVDEAYWTLENLSTGEVVHSERSIDTRNEQLIPDWGLSVDIQQYDDHVQSCKDQRIPLPLEGTISHEDPQKEWLTGIEDAEGNNIQNWIRAGNSYDDEISCMVDYHVEDAQSETNYPKDPTESYEGMVQGTWAPYSMVSTCDHHPGTRMFAHGCDHRMDMNLLRSVDIVITDDKSKWTRCPVLEMQDHPGLARDGVPKHSLRGDPAVNKDGEPDNSGKSGMGWFPGYAIDLENGERLNMAFGEDSWLASENGSDMIWNPSNRLFSGNGLDTLLGGKHYVYVFGDASESDNIINAPMPPYDEGEFLYDLMKDGVSSKDLHQIWNQCLWVGAPLLRRDAELLETDVRIRLRVGSEYEEYQPGDELENDKKPMYGFSTSGLATDTSELSVLENEVLDTIKVVPNPYYAYSNYETSRLDNRVKIINLPDRATVRIFQPDGSLVRTLEKDNRSTEMEWDLTNSSRIPISGGLYMVHVKVPDVGETTVKWFGALRPTDMENF